MTPSLPGWLETTRRRRGEDVPGTPFAPGLLEGAAHDLPAARRAVASMLVTLVGDRQAGVTFARGQSCAELDRSLVNVDGELVEPSAGEGADVDELVVGVAAHEGGHLLLSEGPGANARPLRRWLYNLVEDERVEMLVARRWPPLASPLATTRRELLRAELRFHTFLFALFYLVRAPDRLPPRLWGTHERRLRRAIRILTPFPETPREIARAVRRLARIVPHDERHAVPDYPSFVLGTDDGRGRRNRVRRPPWRRDEWSNERPPVTWDHATPDPAGYATASVAVHADACALRAALLAAVRPRRQPLVRRGVLDRRRLHAWPYDDRLFRAARPAPHALALALILDLSGSMHEMFDTVRHVAVAFSEAATGLRHVRLHVYGHTADGGGFPCTEIIRFATPARGPVLSLGTLPRGANNRDGHALEIIAQDLAEREPSRRSARFGIHVCDGDPSASGYMGLPAKDATRRGLATFRRTFGPLLLLGVGRSAALSAFGAPVVAWKEQGIGELVKAIAALTSAMA